MTSIRVIDGSLSGLTSRQLTEYAGNAKIHGFSMRTHGNARILGHVDLDGMHWTLYKCDGTHYAVPDNETAREVFG